MTTKSSNLFHLPINLDETSAEFKYYKWALVYKITVLNVIFIIILSGATSEYEGNRAKTHRFKGKKSGIFAAGWHLTDGPYLVKTLLYSDRTPVLILENTNYTFYIFACSHQTVHNWGLIYINNQIMYSTVLIFLFARM